MTIQREVWTVERGSARLDVWCLGEGLPLRLPPTVLDEHAERYRRVACAILGVEEVVVQHVMGRATFAAVLPTEYPWLAVSSFYRPGS